MPKRAAFVFLRGISTFTHMGSSYPSYWEHPRFTNFRKVLCGNFGKLESERTDLIIKKIVSNNSPTTPNPTRPIFSTFVHSTGDLLVDPMLSKAR